MMNAKKIFLYLLCSFSCPSLHYFYSSFNLNSVGSFPALSQSPGDICSHIISILWILIFFHLIKQTLNCKINLKPQNLWELLQTFINNPCTHFTVTWTKNWNYSFIFYSTVIMYIHHSSLIFYHCRSRAQAHISSHNIEIYYKLWHYRRFKYLKPVLKIIFVYLFKFHTIAGFTLDNYM